MISIYIIYDKDLCHERVKDKGFQSQIFRAMINFNYKSYRDLNRISFYNYVIIKIILKRKIA